MPISIAALILAAGRGERAGGNGPKQYQLIDGEAVIAHTIRQFLSHPDIEEVVLVIHRDDHALARHALKELFNRITIVEGGATRQDSTYAGLEKLAKAKPDYVHIHDGVRPFISHRRLDAIHAALTPDTGVLLALPVSDTLKKADANKLVTETIDRNGLYSAQTPQSFPFSLIWAAHQQAQEADRHDFTDDSAIAEWQNIAMRIVEGSSENIKITWPSDIALANQRLRSSQAMFPDIRTGNGYDVHAFTTGDGVILCGVKIPFDKKLSGHSDADVALHALTDALLATQGAGDIGTHFPPSDPQWKDAASDIFLRHAIDVIRNKGGRIANVDITLIAEAPKIGPHRAVMTEALVALLDIAPDRISIKATTNEKLGFIGREEGIAAIATATVIYPGEVPA